MNKNIAHLFDLSGKVAVVTGGAMGIGKGIAKRLSECGANILIVDLLKPSEVENELTELKKNGVKVAYVQADLQDVNNISKITEKLLDEFGDVHILVNNAGIYRYVPFMQMTKEIWDKTIDINLKAVMFLSKAMANIMLEKKHGGRIINISSADAFKPTGNLSHYDSSKGGIRMLTKAIAKELGPFGITVNDIAPGGIQTPGVQKIGGDDISDEQREAMQKQTEAFGSMLPLRRMGVPEDIANVAFFLASDASAYMTGGTVIVDGGLLIM